MLICTFKQYKSIIPVLSFTLLIFILASCAAKTGQKAAPEVPLPQQVKQIVKITTSDDTDICQVIVEGSENLKYTSIKQPVPLGVVLYFPETTLKDIPAELAVVSDVLFSIKTSEISENGHTSRIEILLRQDVAYDVSRNQNDLIIIFNKPVAPEKNSPEKNSNAPALSGETRPETAITEESLSVSKPAGTGPAATPAAAQLNIKASNGAVQETSDKTAGSSAKEKQTIIPAKPVKIDPNKTSWLNRIDFSAETAGKSTLIIGTTSPINYRLKKTANKRLELKLLNTNIPTHQQRPLITTRFKCAVDRVTPVQRTKMKGDSLIIIELRESVSYVVEQVDNLLLVHFEQSSIPPIPLDESNLPSWKTVLADTAPTAAAAAFSMSSAKKTALAKVKSQRAIKAGKKTAWDANIYRSSDKKQYVGEKIALDFYNTDIKNVFRILREVSGKNFAIDQDVKGSVTLTLEHPVPWDQVMDLILKMNQLGMVYEQDIIRIGTLSTLKKEQKLRIDRKRADAKAREEAKALQPLITEYIAVNYSNASSEILPHIQNILSKNRGMAAVDQRNNQIINTDVAQKIKEARKLVKRIDKVTPQVIIEARVVEVSNQFSKELGIEWGADSGPGELDLFDLSSTGNMAMNFPAAGASSSIGFNFSRLTGVPFVLNARLNALETTGEGKILSAPKIVTLDNKKARIKQGLEWAYLERDDAGGSSVKFKNIDLLLEVTPHVTPDNRISLSIYITKNDIASVTDGVPSLSTNEAETELLVNDGDTLVIGGIIKSTRTSGESAFPVLSKIPILGWLFKSQSKSDQSNELLIFITPRIVQLEQRDM